jgi:hypothetical protein
MEVLKLNVKVADKRTGCNSFRCADRLQSSSCVQTGEEQDEQFLLEDITGR